jgi:hypothetical protein
MGAVAGRRAAPGMIDRSQRFGLSMNMRLAARACTPILKEERVNQVTVGDPVSLGVVPQTVLSDPGSCQ